MCAYQFACYEKDEKGNMYTDAIAAWGNQYLLPLGVVSP